MEDLAVFTTLNHSGSFGKNSVEFLKKLICYLPAKVNHVALYVLMSVLAS